MNKLKDISLSILFITISLGVLFSIFQLNKLANNTSDLIINYNESISLSNELQTEVLESSKLSKKYLTELGVIFGAAYLSGEYVITPKEFNNIMFESLEIISSGNSRLEKMVSAIKKANLPSK